MLVSRGIMSILMEFAGCIGLVQVFLIFNKARSYKSTIKKNTNQSGVHCGYGNIKRCACVQRGQGDSPASADRLFPMDPLVLA